MMGKKFICLNSKCPCNNIEIIWPYIQYGVGVSRDEAGVVCHRLGHLAGRRCGQHLPTVEPEATKRRTLLFLDFNTINYTVV